MNSTYTFRGRPVIAETSEPQAPKYSSEELDGMFGQINPKQVKELEKMFEVKKSRAEIELDQVNTALEFSTLSDALRAKLQKRQQELKAKVKTEAQYALSVFAAAVES